MEEIHHLATKKYGIDGMDMLEEAGKYLAKFVLSLKPSNIIVFYGTGTNAGGGLAAARHILEHNCAINLISVAEETTLLASLQLDRLRMLGIPQNAERTITRKTVVIDALAGYGLRSKPDERLSLMINEVNDARHQGATVVSLDIPSGVDATTGEMYVPHVVADYTVTLALPKVGLMKAKDAVGKLYLADIGVPLEVYTQLGIDAEIPAAPQTNITLLS